MDTAALRRFAILHLLAEFRESRTPRVIEADARVASLACKRRNATSSAFDATSWIQSMVAEGAGRGERADTGDAGVRGAGAPDAEVAAAASSPAARADVSSAAWSPASSARCVRSDAAIALSTRGSRPAARSSSAASRASASARTTLRRRTVAGSMPSSRARMSDSHRANIASLGVEALKPRSADQPWRPGLKLVPTMGIT